MAWYAAMDDKLSPSLVRNTLDRWHGPSALLSFIVCDHCGPRWTNGAVSFCCHDEKQEHEEL